MLKNDVLVNLVAKIGVDTAENGPSKERTTTFEMLSGIRWKYASSSCKRSATCPIGITLRSSEIEQLVHMIFWIDADFDNHSIILQHFSRSTKNITLLHRSKFKYQYLQISFNFWRFRSKSRWNKGRSWIPTIDLARYNRFKLRCFHKNMHL